MCDIYNHKCIICGKKIDMHLGDYNTGREEVAVFHEECFEKAVKRFDADEGRVVVVSVTDNALANQDHNHPNS